MVLATARTPLLDGNLLAIHGALRRRRPDLRIELLLEPYSYGLRGKLAYLLRLFRGMVLLRTSGWFIVDNAYLPIHVMPHRSGTTVVQVWHAVGALKRFGWDSRRPLGDPERRFLHRYYDWVVCTSERAREPYARAFRIPADRVLPLGAPRIDALVQPRAVEVAGSRLREGHPELRSRVVVLHAPTFRGRGAGKQAATHLDAVALRAALPADHLLVLKTHPNLDPAATPTAGYDLVLDPRLDLDEVLPAVDILVTDYSSSIFEWAWLHRPLVLLVPDLAAYETDPGLYLDYRTEMIGTLVTDTHGVAEAIRDAAVDHAAWDAFIAEHLGPVDGSVSDRFVDRFFGPRPAGPTHR